MMGWVGCDSLYGGTAAFIDGVEDLGERFVGNVDKTSKVWTQEPKLRTSVSGNSGRGRPPKHSLLGAENEAEYVSVEALSRCHFEEESRKTRYRQGTKGEL